MSREGTKEGRKDELDAPGSNTELLGNKRAGTGTHTHTQREGDTSWVYYAILAASLAFCVSLETVSVAELVATHTHKHTRISTINYLPSLSNL